MSLTLILGYCGLDQAGANDVAFAICALEDCKVNVPFGSHTLCPELYNSAFDYPFYANNVEHCLGVTTENVPSDFKMGYNELRTNVTGVFASPTYAEYPYNSKTPGDNIFTYLISYVVQIVSLLISG